MIYVECYAHFTLVKSITDIPKKEIIRVFGRGRVCTNLQKNQNSKGLVDEDPGWHQPGYMEKMMIKEDLPLHGIRVLYDNHNNNYLFVLCPKLGGWIIKATKEAKIDIQKYNLPNNPQRLHKFLEGRTKLDKFEKLIKDLKEKSKMLKTLAKLIRER